MDGENLIIGFSEGKMKGKTYHLVDIVQKKFGTETFEIGDVDDPKTRKLILKFLCFKKNIPNYTSQFFEITDYKKADGKYITKKFKLRKGVMKNARNK